MKVIDQLAIDYKSGDETAFDPLVKRVIEIISSNAELIWYKLKNHVNFECRCLMKIKRALAKFDEEKGKFSSLLFGIIKEERGDFLNRRSREAEHSIEAMTSVNDDGSIQTFEIEDVNANFEVALEEKARLNEKITLLAQGDKRKRIILESWVDGDVNDLALGKLLAQLLGGKIESHRKFVQRFRNECQRRLAGVV